MIFQEAARRGLGAGSAYFSGNQRRGTPGLVAAEFQKNRPTEFYLSDWPIFCIVKFGKYRPWPKWFRSATSRKISSPSHDKNLIAPWGRASKNSRRGPDPLSCHFKA